MWQEGILDGGEGGVCLERLGKVLRAGGTDIIVVEPANEKGVGLSMAADSNGKGSTGSEEAYSMLVSV